ncbi:hypothetical protein ZRA01_33230 [Zoogloea ramigera]|uniref:Uncharacterized protein n=1 Tax=Zoogloea ramigera TaxID=350 RepID=A0A4Y4D3A0_ZOORA|nr:hypothetical protein ZRA01_33230 [Zoogloea ramigera]
MSFDGSKGNGLPIIEKPEAHDRFASAFIQLNLDTGGAVRKERSTVRSRAGGLGMVLGIAVRGIVGMCFVCLGTVMLCISMLLCVGMALTF